MRNRRVLRRLVCIRGFKSRGPTLQQFVARQKPQLHHSRDRSRLLGHDLHGRASFSFFGAGWPAPFLLHRHIRHQYFIIIYRLVEQTHSQTILLYYLLQGELLWAAGLDFRLRRSFDEAAESCDTLSRVLLDFADQRPQSFLVHVWQHSQCSPNILP